jgi:hypothetical protein
MSTQVVEAVTERLETTGRRWWVLSLLAGALLAASASLGALVLFVLAVTLGPLSRLGLAILFGFWAVWTAALAVGVIVRARKGRRGLAATARRLELEFPALQSRLINVVQLAEPAGQGPDEFCAAAVAQAAAEVEEFPFEKAPIPEGRWRRFVLGIQTPRDVAEAGGVLATVLAVAFGLHALIPGWAASTDRLLHPWTFVPAVGSVKIVNVTPGDTEVLVGANLEIAAEIDNPAHKPYPATMYVRPVGEPETAQPMRPDEHHQKFVAALPQVLRPFRYRLEVGDSQTPVYTVGVRDKPTVAAVEVTYHYPAYLGRAAQTVTQDHADLEAPQFTVAQLTLHPSTPVAQGHLLVEGKRHPCAAADDGLSLVAYLLLQTSTTYTVHLVNDVGHTDPEPRVNRIQVQPDAPPTVQLVEPAREGTAAPGGKVPVVVRAGDDHGLGLVRIEVKTEEEGKAVGVPETVASWTKFPNPASAVLNHALTLDKAHCKPGQTLLVRAVARDRRSLEIDRFGIKLQLQPQEAATAWHQVHLVAPEAKSAADLAQLDALRAALWGVLQKQLLARVAAAQVRRQKAPADAARLAGEVRRDQIEIQKATVVVVESIGKGADEERLVIKRAANKLAFGDMIEAVRQAEALAQVKDVAGLAKPAAALTATQDRIIDVLRRLLNETRRETADRLAEMDKRANTDLPRDVQDKLRELRDKLKEFLKEQKKVIEATENLAKMPVDDFTDKEKELLKKLAALEDDWSRFLAEKHSDLSKLPEQDFANPSLLKELLEVQTELKMAKDALTQKSADIAVPLEQLGAEMAKELTTNIEKWLPDTPDRERWSQEEPLTDAMKEAPMAELPGELEDIVGKLMEEEEDLFDEMEDASSSWADSIDKGAGWDAMDGPIANNSAKGVTGNRLPNTSEIAGRSGEGRQGKSSGEFVGDTAVGKGGRKTPSRLTPDPQVKGKVKDHSRDPTGGATGGGKESGQGGEGLKGPVPKRAPQSPARLAGKQAELRNKAEGVDLQFQVLKYHHTDLQKLIGMMAAVEQDLRSGRYQSALRRRDVLLDSLGRVKLYVKGETTIRQDQTVNLPTDIQKEILGSMQEPSPGGWEKLNRQYFERLGQGAAPPKPPPAGGKAPLPPRADKE